MSGIVIPVGKPVLIASSVRAGAYWGLGFEFDGPVSKIYAVAELVSGSVSGSTVMMHEGLIPLGDQGTKPGQVALTDITSGNTQTLLNDVRTTTAFTYGGHGYFSYLVNLTGAVNPVINVAILGVS